MSRIVNVLKNKNRLEKEAMARRNRELQRMKKEASYKARLRTALKQVDNLLEKSDIKSLLVEIPKASIAEFTRVIYEPDMAEYSIRQLTVTKFAISRKEVDF